MEARPGTNSSGGDFRPLVDGVVAAFAWTKAPLLGEVMAALWLTVVVGAVLMAARRPKLGSRLI